MQVVQLIPQLLTVRAEKNCMVLDPLLVYMGLETVACGHEAFKVKLSEDRCSGVHMCKVLVAICLQHICNTYLHALSCAIALPF